MTQPVEPRAHAQRTSHAKRFRVALFLLYAGALFTLTHWPRLTLDVPGVERPDLFVHMTAYGLWTALLLISGLFGSAQTRAGVIGAGLFALLWSGLDELSQALPFVHRQASWDDALANWSGVALALSIAVALLFRSKGRSRNDHTTTTAS